MPRLLSNPSYVCHLDWSAGYRAFSRLRRKRVRPPRLKYPAPLLNLQEARGSAPLAACSQPPPNPLTPELRNFIKQTLVPILVTRYIHRSQQSSPAPNEPQQ
jgi:hypothetical protein